MLDAIDKHIYSIIRSLASSDHQNRVIGSDELPDCFVETNCYKIALPVFMKQE